jgi:multiple sugar transport system substrate-binding protein
MKKFLSIILAVSMIGTSATAFGAASRTAAPATEIELPEYTGEPAELRFGWWGDDNRAALTNSVIEEFEKAYPDIKVSGEPNGGTADHFNIVDTQLAGDNAPDIIQFGGNYPDYINYLEPLDDYVGKQLQVETEEEFDQGPLVNGSMDDTLYGISVGTNTLMLVYNKDMLERVEAPLPEDEMTWEEFIEYGKTIAPLLEEEDAFPFVDNSVNQANYLSYFLTQRGEDLWTFDEESLATEEAALDWFNLWEDMREDGLIPDIETVAAYAETGPDTSTLVAGLAAFGLIWSNQVASYQSAMEDSLAVCALPLGENPAQAIQVSQYIGVNKNSDNLEAAVLFVNFFVTSPVAGAILGTNRGVPSSPIVREAIAEDASEIDALVYEYYNLIAEQGRTVPQGPNLPNDIEFVDELRRIGQSVAFEEFTREEGAEELYNVIQRLIKK